MQSRRAGVVLLIHCMLAGAAMAGEFIALATDHSLWPRPVLRQAYGLLATDSEFVSIDTLPPLLLPPYLARFWKKRDPSPTTDANEYKDQFEKRVEYALLHYSDPAGSRPWDQRGDVYVRLGEPDEKHDSVFNWYAPQDTLRAAQLNKSGFRSHNRRSGEATGMERWLRNPHLKDYGEVWIYFRENLKLQFQGLHLSYELVPFVSTIGEYQSLAEFADDVQQIDTTAPLYQTEQGVAEARMAIECFPFRRIDGQYDCYFACGIPLSRIATSNSHNSWGVDCSMRIVVLDSTLAVRWSDSISYAQEYLGKASGKLLRGDFATVLAPGSYIFSVEALSPLCQHT